MNDWGRRDYEPPQWRWESVESTITVSAPMPGNDYYVVQAVPKAWQCPYCRTKHADADSPCPNCGAPELVYVLGAR